MTTITQIMTAQDLLALPDDGLRYELVRGELRRMSPAGRKHGRLVMNVSTPLDQYVRANQLGEVYTAETGFILATSPDVVRAPDVSFVSAQRAAAVADEEGFFPGPPDLAVEVVSPSDLYTEVDEKVRDYLDAGTRMVIIVNPRREAVTVYRSPSSVTLLAATDVLDGADVVLGWSIAVAAIFALPSKETV
jgi:Uma2 family endonuclease